MPLRADIPNLVQGISKQPPATKEFNRPSVQSNFYPHPILGLMDRPPSKFVADANQAADSTAYWTLTEMREDEQYIIRIANDGVRVWDVQGEEYHVEANDFDYLSARTGGNLVTDPEDPSTVNWTRGNCTAATISSGSPTGGAYEEMTVSSAGTNATIIQQLSGTTYVEDTVGATRKVTGSAYIQAPTDGLYNYSYSVSLVDSSLTDGVGVSATLSTAGVWSAIPTGSASALFQIEEAVVEDLGNGFARLSVLATIEEGSIPAGNQGSLETIYIRVDHLSDAGATGDSLKFGLWGLFVAVSTQSIPDYLSEPANSFETLSTKDFTYVLNKNRKVINSAAGADTSPGEVTGEDSSGASFPVGDGLGWLWIRQWNFSTRYLIGGLNEDPDGGGSDIDWRVGIRTWNGNNSQAFDEGSVFLNSTATVARQLGEGGEFWKTGTSISSLSEVSKHWDSQVAGERPNFLSIADVEGSSSTDLFNVDIFGSVAQFDPVGNAGFVENPYMVSDVPRSISLILRSVRSLADLPTEGFDGKKVIVDADPEVGSPVTYYKFVVEEPDSSNADSGNGVWEETYGFGVKLALDASSMPHGLTRKVDDSSGTVSGEPYGIYFEFAPIDWDDRLVGDEDSSPTPSFVSTDEEDRYIKHLFFYKNRLGVLSKDNIIFSETGRFTNFYRTTAEQLVTSDPIDVRVNSRKVRELDDTFETQGRLYVRAEDTIFEVGDSGQLLSAESIQILPRIDLHTDRLAFPIVTDKTVMMTDRLQRYTQVYDVFQSNFEKLESARVTEEVLDLVEPRIQHMTASSSLGLLCLVPEAPDTTTSSPTLYMLSYLWQGNQKVQSAWWTMDFGDNDTVRFAEFYEDTLFLVMERDQQVYFSKITFDMPKQQSSDWEVLCDDQIPLSELTIVESGGDSTITCPWPVDESYTYYIVYDGTGSPDKGDRVNEAVNAITPSNSAGTIVVTGLDLTSASGYLGIRYNRTFEFDTFRPKEPAPTRGRVAISNAEATFHELVLNFKNTVEFKVKSINRRTYTQTYSSDTGSGNPPLNTGSKRIPLYGDASRTTLLIENTSPRPSILTSGEVIFSLRARGRATSL